MGRTQVMKTHRSGFFGHAWRLLKSIRLSLARYGRPKLAAEEDTDSMPYRVLIERFTGEEYAPGGVGYSMVDRKAGICEVGGYLTGWLGSRLMHLILQSKMILGLQWLMPVCDSAKGGQNMPSMRARKAPTTCYWTFSSSGSIYNVYVHSKVGTQCFLLAASIACPKSVFD
ncbi:hypothetical protein LX32DRAFT_650937 [Colletotrichum zoysiae]|uniref:Uncharacterized protein n=1 Tax=Colletotrichum zoysiae TaxID=1216348 RepID=A0AAD9HNP7_9PEZI|nr:hypothetical protein LX32DRAFT_650937 [Colletotrichum zoysiae]